MKRALQVVALAFGARAATAQSSMLPPTRVLITAGANFAKIAGDNSDSDNRIGFVGGVGLVKPIAPNWAIQPELTYSMKGGEGSDATDKTTVKLSYLEIPVLLRYDFTTSGGARPFFQAGPALAFKLGCSVEVESGGVSGSADCDAAPGGDNVKSFDLGAMLGAGVGFKRMNHVISVGLRYNFGLIEIADNSHTKNRVLSIVGAFEWPWGK